MCLYCSPPWRCHWSSQLYRVDVSHIPEISSAKSPAVFSRLYCSMLKPVGVLCCTAETVGSTHPETGAHHLSIRKTAHSLFAKMILLSSSVPSRPVASARAPAETLRPRALFRQSGSRCTLLARRGSLYVRADGGGNGGTTTAAHA